MPFLTTRIGKLRGLVRARRLNVWKLEGIEKSSSAALGILYAGSAAQKNYFSHLAFGGPARESDLGKAWLHDVLRDGMRAENGCAISVVEMTSRYFRAHALGAGFYVPAWLDCELAFDSEFERAKRSGNVKEDLRRIRKNELSYEVTRDRKRIDDFFHNMYLPYIRRAHGNRAVFHSYERLCAKIDRCELLVVKNRESAPVAGQVLIHEDHGVRTRELGVRGGDLAHVRSGALAALYYFGLSYLREKGYASVDLGASRAFLDDGVLRFKRKWGMRVTGARSRGFFIRLGDVTRAAAAFLAHNPFVHECGGKLHGAVFVAGAAGASEDALRNLRERYRIPGIEQLRFYALEEAPALIETPAAAAGAAGCAGTALSSAGRD